ncbi:hypothetical protein GCM10023188_21120 [Pontibacter saemangeumensis]|uniref:Uncharacterized protein n=1 Tax=Pontibacter saemangeumensis TaxID=1084525 RepID=A0ABP8LNU3_9BACT
MGTYAHQRNDAPYFPDGTVAAYDNATLPQGTITKTHEQQEYQIWLQKLRKHNITLGPATTSPDSPASLETSLKQGKASTPDTAPGKSGAASSF